MRASGTSTAVPDPPPCASPPPVLRRGRSTDSNPGAATPHSLYKLYKAQGAVMANPCTLRQEFGARAPRPLALSAPTARPRVAAATPRSSAAPLDRDFRVASLAAHAATPPPPPPHGRSYSPPRMQFKVLQPRGASADARSIGTVQLSLASLNMNSSRTRQHGAPRARAV